MHNTVALPTYAGLMCMKSSETSNASIEADVGTMRCRGVSQAANKGCVAVTLALLNPSDKPQQNVAAAAALTA